MICHQNFSCFRENLSKATIVPSLLVIGPQIKEKRRDGGGGGGGGGEGGGELCA